MHEQEAAALLNLRREADDLGVEVTACQDNPLGITLRLEGTPLFSSRGPAAARRCMDWLAGYRHGRGYPKTPEA